MKRRELRLALMTAVILGGVAAVACAQQRAAPPARPTRQQQAGINKWVAAFRAARKDLPRRQQLVREATKHGRPLVEALAGVIEKEMRPQLKRYCNQFTAQAKTATAKQATKANVAEVAKLRQQVLGLQGGANFTKENIVAVADPAMQRLAQIILVDRNAVLARSKKLQAERDRITQLGKLWEQCGVYLFKTAADNNERTREPPNFEKYLQGEEELAVGMAAPMPAQTRAVLAANAKLAGQVEAEEARAIAALNLTRMLLGLPPVVIDLKLAAAARGHSQDMKRLAFFGHDSPVRGKSSPWDRAALAGTKANAENIYRGVTDGHAANEAWFHSPPHQKNMLGPYTRVGIGRAGTYYTEMFGK